VTHANYGSLMLMIKLREVEKNDILPLAEFLPRGFPFTTKEFWLARFEMWWNKNPAWTNDIPMGWVLDDGKNLVGFIGNIPVPFIVRGEKRLAAASSSWFVDPSVRGIYSVRLFNEFMKQKNASLFLFKAEEEYVMNFLTKYRFNEYILPKSQKEYGYILNRKDVIFNFSKFIFNKKVPKFSELPELYKRTGLLILGYLFQKSEVNPNASSPDEYITSLCRSCDDSFSGILRPTLDQCDVVMSYDTSTLDWLYFSEARWFKRVVIQCRRPRDNHLAGYMVFDIERNKTSDPGNMRLMDMCIADNDPRVLSSLISFAIETGKQNNAALLIIWANTPETDRYFRNTCPLRRVVQHYRYIRFSDNSYVQDLNENRRNVCPSLIYPPQ
jgi:hypothetical protein